MITLLQSIPAKLRAFIYGTYTAAMFVLGGIQVGYATNGTTQPGWLDVAFNVGAYVGVAIGVTASANTSAARAGADADEYGSKG